MIDDVVYDGFRGNCSEGLELYRALKTCVFRVELAWTSLNLDVDGKVLLDDYDRMSYFICAKVKGNMIGVVRGVSLHDGFPHKHYFEKDLVEKDINSILETGFSINSLAVLAQHRNRYIGTNLLQKIHGHFLNNGKRICLLTAIRGQSEIFFQKCGYRTIGKGFNILNPRMTLCNMVKEFDFHLCK